MTHARPEPVLTAALDKVVELTRQRDRLLAENDEMRDRALAGYRALRRLKRAGWGCGCIDTGTVAQAEEAFDALGDVLFPDEPVAAEVNQ